MTNPLLDELNESLPGVTVALPTKGVFYEPGILAPNADVADIEVNTLSMIDEIRYRDPLLQATGKAVHDIVKRICPAILEPEYLCDIDIEAILLAARIASYGSTIPITHVCENPETYEEVDERTQKPTGNVFPVCRNEIEREVNLEEVMLQYEPVDLSGFFVSYPQYGQVAFLKPISHKTALNMTKIMIEKQRELREFSKDGVEEEILNDEAMFSRYAKLVNITYELSNEILLDSVWYVQTRSGSKVYDRSMIEQWLNKLPDKNPINKMINELNARLRKMSTIEYTCEVCEYVNKVPIVLDADKLFLSEAETSKTQMKSSPTLEKSVKSPKRRLKNLPRSPITTTEPLATPA